MPKRARKELTQRGVDTAKHDLPDGNVSGQRLRVFPSGEKSYAIKVRVHGQQVWITIGDAADMSLADAREKGREIRAKAARGEDPRAAKQEAKEAAANTVAAVAQTYFNRHGHLRTFKQIKYRIEREIIPHWGKRPISSITRKDVLKRLGEIVDRGAPGMANAVHANGRTLFTWAVDQDHIQVSPFYRVKAPAPNNPGERTHTNTELQLIWTAALALGYPWGTFFRLAMLTGQRSSEITGMRWSELDPELTVWTLSPDRNKSKRWHEVPITPLVRHVLATVPRIDGSDFVLTTTGEGPVTDVHMAKRMLDAEITRLNGGAPIPKWVAHDFRRSLASGMAALGVQIIVADKILNHKLKGVQGTYQRHAFASEKVQAMELWSKHILALAGGQLPPSETTRVSQQVGYRLNMPVVPRPHLTKRKLLTPDDIRKLQPGPDGRRKQVRDGGAPGLSLVTRSEKRKDWIVARERQNGRWHIVTIGSADTMPPKQARAVAHKMALEPAPA